MRVVYSPAFYNDYDSILSPLYTRPANRYEAENVISSQPSGSGDSLTTPTERSRMPTQVMVSVEVRGQTGPNLDSAIDTYSPLRGADHIRFQI